jgi:PAS domain S-box-containing protein
MWGIPGNKRLLCEPLPLREHLIMSKQDFVAVPVPVTAARTSLRELMTLAASAGSLDDVYHSALNSVQVGLGIERASLRLFDANGAMPFVAWAGLSEEYRLNVGGFAPWLPTETGAAPILASDIATDPLFSSVAPMILREGIRALAFFPLQFGDRLLGKFSLYYREPHEFTAVEIATAEQVADRVVFALEHHRISVALEEQLVSERELRRRAEQEAAQRQDSENQLHVAIAAGRMGAWNWDIATGLVRWSEQLERMHGVAPGAFMGTLDEVLSFVHPHDLERFTGNLQGVLSSPTREYELEYRIIRPDGACRWLATLGRVLVDSDNAPVQMVGVCSDVTEARRIGEAASAADRRKDDFLATLAHELRNPLAAVRTRVAVIKRDTHNHAVVVESCDVLERQLRHLTRLVDDLLHVADFTRHGLPLEKSLVEFTSVVTAALEQGRPLVEEAGHSLSVQLPAEPIMLDADADRLVQVLMNLLTNAVKYTPHGGTIELVAAREGNDVRFSVRDNGLGIPTDRLESVFEMFGQLDRSLETGHKGLGIGLALCRAIVTMHGGRINAQSNGLGTGSTFSVWLPCEQSAQAPTLHGAETPAGVRAAASCRVLIVDDNKDVVTSTSRWLNLLGHNVRVALDGADAITMAAEFQPDVVLLDIAMPKINGYEVARAIRSAPWGRGMTLVAVTGWGQREDQRRSMDAGFDKHMTKPVDPAALENFLASVARA